MMETSIKCSGCGLIFKTEAEDSTEIIDAWYHHGKQCEVLAKKEARERAIVRVNSFFQAIFMVITIPFAIALSWVEAKAYVVGQWIYEGWLWVDDKARQSASAIERFVKRKR